MRCRTHTHWAARRLRASVRAAAARRGMRLPAREAEETATWAPAGSAPRRCACGSRRPRGALSGAESPPSGRSLPWCRQHPWATLVDVLGAAVVARRRWREEVRKTARAFLRMKPEMPGLRVVPPAHRVVRHAVDDRVVDARREQRAADEL